MGAVRAERIAFVRLAVADPDARLLGRCRSPDRGDGRAVDPRAALGPILGSLGSLPVLHTADRGGAPVDRHTLARLQNPNEPGFANAAFEVIDIDDTILGRERLSGARLCAESGSGRHFVSSHISNALRAPSRRTFERWTGGDYFAAGAGSQATSPQDRLFFPCLLRRRSTKTRQKDPS